MANLLGLILAIVAWWPGSAHAVDPVRRYVEGTGTCVPTFSQEAMVDCVVGMLVLPSGNEWCGDWYVTPDPNVTGAYSWISVRRNYRQVGSSGSCNVQIPSQFYWEPACIDGSPVVGGQCELGPCVAGQRSSAQVFTATAPETFCSFGCTVRIGMCIRLGDDAPLSCDTTTTGASCVPTEHDPGGGAPSEADGEGADDAMECIRKGMTYGSVDGVPMCLPRGTPGGAETEQTGSSTQETDVDGSVTRKDTTTTTVTNIDGSITITTITVTTTGVGTSNEETSTEVDVVTGTPSQICSAQPTLPVCTSGGGGGQGEGDGEGEGGEGSWGGTCAAGFTCDGDPVQCAIAREQHVRACQLFEEENDESLVYADARAGNDPGDAALDPANAETVDVAGSVDADGFLVGACVDDLNVPLWGGQSLTIPFSHLCPYLEIMGAIVLAFSLLAAARIMFV